MTAPLRTADLDRLNPTGQPADLPYLHPALRRLAPLAAALAPRHPQWTSGELAGLTELLARAAAGPLGRLAGHDPQHRWYGRLALTEQVEVWLIGWTPGQGTRPHDHGGASGAFTVLAGRLTETYRDGAAPPREVVLGPPQGSAFGPQRLHMVINAGLVNATSVHAYSPPLLPLGERDSLDDPGPGVAGPERLPAPPLTVDDLLAEARAELPRLGPAEAAAAQRAGALLVDIRPYALRAAEGEIPGALVVERNVLEWRFDPRSTARLPVTGYGVQVVLVCSEGYTSSLAAHALRRLGLYRATDLAGGYRAWRAAGLPTGPGGTPALP